MMDVFVEYLVAKKNSATDILLKIGAILLGLVLCGVTWKFVFPAVPIVAVVAIFVIWRVWRYINVEFEYSLTNGSLDVDIIYGQQSRKTLCSVHAKDFEVCAPVYEENSEYKKYAAQTYAKKIFAASSKNSPRLYYAVFNDPKYGRTLLLFEPVLKMLDNFTFYNPRRVIIGELAKQEAGEENK